MSSAAGAAGVLARTGARGLMIGRGAIRNPWIFAQIRHQLRGESPRLPAGRDVLAYVQALFDAVCTPGVREASQVQKMKKYLNYIGEGVEPTGRFLHEIRRVTTRADFFSVCTDHLAHDRPLALEPGAPKTTDGAPVSEPASSTFAGEEAGPESGAPVHGM